MLLVVVYSCLYIVLSVPSVQNKVKEKVCEEASAYLGGKLGIESLSIRPFSEVILSGVTLLTPENEKCAEIEKVAAGIDIWKLITDRKIVLNYAEILGLDVNVNQKEADLPFNIQFLIDALSPKDKTKPSAKYDLRIRNIVVRNSKAHLSRPWMTDEAGNRLPFADLDVKGLRLDLSIPVLRNDEYEFDIRNLQFDATPGVNLRGLSAEVIFRKDTVGDDGDRLIINNLKLELPNTSLAVGDVDICLKSINDVRALVEGKVTPSDFSGLVEKLSEFNAAWDLKVDALYKDNAVGISELNLSNKELSSDISIEGNLANLNHRDSISVEVSKLHADISSKLINVVVADFLKVKEKEKKIIEGVGGISLDVEGSLIGGKEAEAKGKIATESGSIDFTANGKDLKTKKPQISLKAIAEGIELDKLLATDKIGKISFDLDAEISGLDRNAEGHVTLTSDECILMGNELTGIDLDLKKSKNDLTLTLDMASNETSVNIDAEALLAGKLTEVEAELEVAGLTLSDYGIKGKMSDCEISAKLTTITHGNNLDNITGLLDVRDLSIVRPDGNSLTLKNLTLEADSLHGSTQSKGTLQRDIRLSSDWIDARMTGEIVPCTLVRELKDLIETIFPTLISPATHLPDKIPSVNDFTFDINIKGVSAPYAFFDTPVRPLTDIPVIGRIDLGEGKSFIKASTPHLQQGKNKLIRDVDFSFDADSFLGMAKMRAGLIFPAKKGDVELAADIYAVRDKVSVNLGLNPTMESVLKGGVALEASFSRRTSPFSPKGDLAIVLNILPSTVTVSDKAWTIGNGTIDYSGKRIDVSNFLIRHDDQYVKIDGVASESDTDAVKVVLNDIDLEYIFNILNINYVSFGGMATGEVVGRRLLTKNLEAQTEYLHVKELSYNGAVLGNADIASDYDVKRQKVGIYGVIRDPLTRERRVSVDGGIWVTRDSLSFGFDANRVNVEIMKPFVSAFCSDLHGKASGKCKLYGTFSDIDLVGDLKADTLSMKLDFTNTWYHAGNDSVYLRNGIIDIPPLTLYDDEGHSAEFSGWLRHTYFHNPIFNFRLRDAKSLLCYDTNEKLNPLWYGTIYGSGHAQINGNPGLIEIDMNMATEEGSKFYYVISDTEDVAQYSFLSFTDKRKERQEAAVSDTIPDYLLKFQKHNEEMEAGSSNVVLSIKGTVTNDALVTLVMDPKAGDNITARGQGALQMDYNLASNDLRMIGIYTLDEGNYTFTLQDFIIKNFNIRKGSLIKFDGDPMNANLDIAATYRVNTNLSDLDKSFSSDKELNRTNVPVDAMLLVKGPMTNPDITFDIELPTLTSDVERKVKSLVSTNDMMSRQIIYLLALNRFYTPEYTGGQSNGAEWSSMASSTISSQLSNILSQMTDKLDVAPSFRSDKGDFTDMEFDLALSSRLLNNRLLINGNFGYRDKTTSNTQFVGDFDIEYLLNRSGKFRLKAYNHFNDQNYYLRSALTTQGVGVVFQKDFDRLFRRKKEKVKEDEPNNKDTIPDREVDLSEINKDNKK